MADTTIEWADKVWNPTHGCNRVSAGCDNCYAMHFAHRFSGPGQRFEGITKRTSHGTDWSGRIQLNADKLGEPFKWRKPQRVFVDSMSDLFHHEVPDEFILRVFTMMRATQQHTYQVLTKRPERMQRFARRLAWRTPTTEERDAGVTGWQAYLSESVAGYLRLPNVWLGTSVEDQRAADERIPHLLETPARVLFLSCEPLLGPVDLEAFLSVYDNNGEPSGPRCKPDGSSVLDWIIVGGESGHGARPMHPDWARGLRDQCQEAGVAYFFKQWGEHAPWYELLPDVATVRGARVEIYPDGRIVDLSNPDPDCRDWPWLTMVRAGKHKAGRRLDGRTWDEMPAVPS